ncbi:hypothetical protein VL2_gp139 [Pseudomonas phage vB_PaeM_VL12]|uniref:Cyanophage baseplate Pam3 plug gp18 domain-containing protein n=12 Tax=Nankokuvirus TaxID=1925779 RepID=A0A218L3X1_9CAUD|nr:virion structural protein [Pseudomonas phage KPP10]YP_008856895.1 virion structural protein [Pseudomonas phage PAK_P5]YP_008857654.1 virion structural protein [Pseudomonas phage PAK_P3]YP_008858042.1 virion structural protein [Pseudomonas phage CHA_P1]YP_009206033.1 virion structural protein [Pseudomonas phage vB_PaeM_PS24]YP_009604696.1 virion structural protein [Pseudomonas phage vB_PaeM_G1]ADX32019.1 hypothetical protein P3_CHA0019 [Pseudomonas phage P3_CHA]QEM40945.1 hypothetical prot
MAIRERARLVELPTYRDPQYAYQMKLGDQIRYLSFSWSDRQRYWHMTVENMDGEVIIRNMKLVPNYPLGYDYGWARYGLNGYFLVLPDNHKNDICEDISTLNEFFELYYVEIEEYDDSEEV